MPLTNLLSGVLYGGRGNASAIGARTSTTSSGLDSLLRFPKQNKSFQLLLNNSTSVIHENINGIHI